MGGSGSLRSDSVIKGKKWNPEVYGIPCAGNGVFSRGPRYLEKPNNCFDTRSDVVHLISYIQKHQKLQWGEKLKGG
ncbi:MAG: hypothetical protein CM1200mP3_10710 [Chloroflexota bacterium]|nr:MAG: hypothetical protein CM1200mP3_10710 [Chloroflexota bacterium]